MRQASCQMVISILTGRCATRPRTFTTISAEVLQNQVSEDGHAAFFISPDPGSESGRPSELYVRLTAADGTKLTELVSRDLLLPESGGQPAGAPTGIPHLVTQHEFFASPDGSHTFFESMDQLTPDALPTRR